MTGIDNHTKDLIIAVTSVIEPKAKIILFGSRARGDFSARADIDIALDAGSAIDLLKIGEIRDMLNASSINLGIDIVDLNNIPQEMVENIRNEGILWKK